MSAPATRVEPAIVRVNEPALATSILNQILDITKDHEGGCECAWDRAFDALAEVRA